MVSLARAAEVLGRAGDIAALLQSAVDEARFTFDASSAVAAQLSDDRLEIRAAHPETTAGDPLPVADLSCSTPVLLELRPALLTESDKCLVSDASGIVVPIIAERRAWGLLAVGRGADQDPFDVDDLPLAQAFSGILTAGLSQVAHLEQVQRIALADPLTGVGNRRLIEATVEEFLAAGRPFALLMADVNLLKHINDTLGHAAGDEALVGVANVLADVAKQHHGVVGRMGGDEFCVVVPQADAESGMSCARAIAERWDEVPHGSSAALGVAVAAPGETLRSLLAAVDAAQYQAKAAGSREPVLADPAHGGSDRRRWRGRARAEQLLRDGLARLAGVGGDQPRLAAVVSGLAADVGARGWVLSRIDAQTGLPMAGHGEGGVVVDSVVPVPSVAAWVQQARSGGVVLVDDPPLAASRGAQRVVVSIVGDWMGEVLLGSDGPADDSAAVLKALMAVALVEPGVEHGR